MDEPSATIEILGYPPIYVVGDVAKPGEYQFHTGLTVLQAFAMGGGEMRSTSTLQSSLDVTQLVGELKEIDASIVRAGVTIKRLEAETAGEKTLQFQQELSNADPLTASICKQEEAIFLARANGGGPSIRSRCRSCVISCLRRSGFSKRKSRVQMPT